MKCKICKNNSNIIFTATVLNKYNISYYQCNTCLFIQTETPFWVEEAYSDAISNLDTGILLRNIDISKKLSSLLPYFITSPEIKCLDYSGGYGILVRLMRDIGYDFYWYDKYCKNIFARGFEFVKNYPYKIITAFEVVEHLSEPLSEIYDLIINNSCETLIFSTELVNKTFDKNWWYFAFESGQHISFYNIKTIEYMAEKFNMYCYSIGSFFHIFSKKKMKLKELISAINKKPKQFKNKLKSKTFSDHQLLKMTSNIDKEQL
jgi:hypothetical protein